MARFEGLHDGFSMHQTIYNVRPNPLQASGMQIERLKKDDCAIRRMSPLKRHYATRNINSSRRQGVMYIKWSVIFSSSPIKRMLSHKFVSEQFLLGSVLLKSWPHNDFTAGYTSSHVDFSCQQRLCTRVNWTQLQTFSL